MSICNETITSSTFIMYARDSRMVARLKEGTVWCNLRKLFSINYNSEARGDEILIHSGWKVRMILDISSRNFSLAAYGVIVIVYRRARWRRDEYSRNTFMAQLVLGSWNNSFFNNGRNMIWSLSKWSMIREFKSDPNRRIKIDRLILASIEKASWMIGNQRICFLKNIFTL